MRTDEQSKQLQWILFVFSAYVPILDFILFFVFNSFLHSFHFLFTMIPPRSSKVYIQTHVSSLPLPRSSIEMPRTMMCVVADLTATITPTQEHYAVLRFKTLIPTAFSLSSPIII